MRKLLLVPVLCLTSIAPSAFGAAPPDNPGAGKLVTLRIANPLALEAAERRQRIVKRRVAARLAAEKPVAVPSHLQAIAQCESGGDPTAIGGGGLYRGKYQFSVETWQAVGGKGDPAAAPEAEQDRRAIILYDQSGPGQWPVCGA